MASLLLEMSGQALPLDSPADTKDTVCEVHGEKPGIGQFAFVLVLLAFTFWYLAQHAT